MWCHRCVWACDSHKEVILTNLRVAPHWQYPHLPEGLRREACTLICSAGHKSFRRGTSPCRHVYRAVASSQLWLLLITLAEHSSRTERSRSLKRTLVVFTRSPTNPLNHSPSLPTQLGIFLFLCLTKPTESSLCPLCSWVWSVVSTQEPGLLMPRYSVVIISLATHGTSWPSPSSKSLQLSFSFCRHRAFRSALPTYFLILHSRSIPDIPISLLHGQPYF